MSPPNIIKVSENYVDPPLIFMRCKPGGTTEFFYPKDFKDNTYQIWNFGFFL